MTPVPSSELSSNCSTTPRGPANLGRNARLLVQTSFDPDAEADRLVELYREVLDAPSQPEI